MKTKYCIISGLAGFNDFLNTLFRGCQIVDYGRSKNREIKIITHWTGFQNTFWNFFQHTDLIDVEIEKSEEFLQNIGCYKAHPYKYTYSHSNIGIEKHYIPSDIDWDSDCWDYIVEFFSGQWDYSNSFFKYLRLKDDFKKELKHILDFLDHNNYICVNFRMQEMIKADLERKLGSKIYTKDLLEKHFKLKLDSYCDNLKEIKNKNPNKKIVLCTDSIHLINEFKNIDNIFSFGYAKKILDSGIDMDLVDKFKGIHMGYYTNLNLTSYDVCKYAFIDYFLMSMAEELYPSEFGYFGKAAQNLKKYLDSNETMKTFIY